MIGHEGLLEWLEIIQVSFNGLFLVKVSQPAIFYVNLARACLKNRLLVGTPLLSLKPSAAPQIYKARWPVEGLPQAGKYILSGGLGRHYVHHPTAMKRVPILSLLFGSLLKYVAATLPPFRTGFWDKVVKPTYGRLLRQLKKVGIPLSVQLSKKASVTSHLPVGYDAIRLADT